MPKKPESDKEKKIDEIQKKIEKIETKEIMEDYKEHTPAYIWFLKVSLVLVIFLSIILMTLSYMDVLDAFFLIVLCSILFYGIYERKRWSWYFGLFLFAFATISSIVNNKLLSTPAYIGFFILLYIHKDYLNKKSVKKDLNAL